MWTCPICSAEVEEDAWETCWKCSSSRSVSGPELERLRKAQQEKVDRYQRCLRCENGMTYAGTRRFHEGAKMGFWLGDIGELFVNQERYDVYFCQHCGKVEFYIDGIGDDLRGEKPEG